jgi:hypothetical protein
MHAPHRERALVLVLRSRPRFVRRSSVVLAAGWRPPETFHPRRVRTYDIACNVHDRKDAPGRVCHHRYGGTLTGADR